MAVKKKKTKSPKKKTSTKSSKKTKKTRKKSTSNDNEIDTGIIIVDDDLSRDKEAELEERRAFLEEARSQEASD